MLIGGLPSSLQAKNRFYEKFGSRVFSSAVVLGEF